MLLFLPSTNEKEAERDKKQFNLSIKLAIVYTATHAHPEYIHTTSEYMLGARLLDSTAFELGNQKEDETFRLLSFLFPFLFFVPLTRPDSEKVASRPKTCCFNLAHCFTSLHGSKRDTGSRNIKKK